MVGADVCAVDVPERIDGNEAAVVEESDKAVGVVLVDEVRRRLVVGEVEVEVVVGYSGEVVVWCG
jgi:hypothetical protein